jgi:hypothetical protein
MVHYHGYDPESIHPHAELDWQGPGCYMAELLDGVRHVRKPKHGETVTVGGIGNTIQAFPAVSTPTELFRYIGLNEYAWHKADPA